MKQRSFGGVVAEAKELAEPNWISNVPALLADGNYLPVGMGKSYGDVALSTDSKIVSSLALNRMISWDAKTGVLVCEAGVLLSDIQSTFVKQGWMLAVSPGTSYITVGGAVANDIHGKDHHFAGTFGDHVLGFTLVRSDGESMECTPELNPEMFRATIGGLGLTGFITTVRIKLRQVAGPYFDTEVIPFSNLDEFFAISKETEIEQWQASVSWFDCSTSKAGRGSFTRGNSSLRPGEQSHTDSEPGLSIPFTPPISLVNKVTLDRFNSGYFHSQKRAAGKGIAHYREFYYPLDGVRDWNRIYGPRGFFQYQSVIPMTDSAEATSEMLSIIKKSGQGSFLAVLKTFGERPPSGLLSFARGGVTLALDFPNRGDKTEKLMSALDRVVSEAGGTLNPSKDARMSREMFQAGFPGVGQFARFRDPKIVSDFSRRVID
jgi:FAD/FMN-containing dehydrogenase